ncbi:MAG: chloramphenicol acetyltransferase [Alcanivoracaceae bacterium]|nr:chloramphenicol acetyltransferase [Alcanivoracaceae bacterium]
MYKILDLNNWSRYEQYKFFKSYDSPFFNICSELDVTDLVKSCQSKKLSFFISILYASLSAANQIKEFRYRLKNDGVVEFDTIYAGSTILKDDETFSFCYFDYFNRFSAFNNSAKQDIAKAKTGNLKFAARDNELGLIHYSSIPWISFSSFSHARNFKNNDSIPKIVFGKFYEKDGRISLPISVEVHHALMDGLHLGRYLDKLQKMIKNPTFLTI